MNANNNRVQRVALPSRARLAILGAGFVAVVAIALCCPAESRAAGFRTRTASVLAGSFAGCSLTAHPDLNTIGNVQVRMEKFGAASGTALLATAMANPTGAPFLQVVATSSGADTVYCAFQSSDLSAAIARKYLRMGLLVTDGNGVTTTFVEARP